MSSAKSKRSKSRKVGPKSTRPERHWLRKFSAIVVGAVGLTVAVLSLFPRLSISNGAPIDTGDPFSVPFRVVNEGYLPLFDVKIFMADISVKDTSGGGTTIVGHAFMRDWQTSTFWPNDAFDLYPDQVIGTHFLASANMSIVVQYRPFGFLYERQKIFRFITRIGPDNKLHWMQRPAN